MNVLLIHESGSSHGSGAVVSMQRLHKALQAKGVGSTIACRRPGDEDRPDVVELPRSDRLESLLGKVSWRLGLNDIHCVSSFKLPTLPAFLNADVINIHGWHTNFFNYLALPKIARSRPVVASLHDMWNFTGHCATALECERWKIGCGKCPHLDTFPRVKRDATRIDWKLKNWAYRQTSMIVTTPSKWLAQCASESMLGRFRIRHIPPGLDTKLFRPMDRAACRAALGIPPDAHVVMFAAADLTNSLKGPDLLLEAIEHLPKEIKSNLLLLVLGEGGAAMAELTKVKTLDLGYVTDDTKKIQCYSAADLFVLPTRAEVMGLVLLEAMACGTPCVAFDVGGVGELVIPDKTGYLAQPEDVEDLRCGIQMLLDDSALREKFGRQSLDYVLDHHTMEQHVYNYIDVYHQARQLKAA